MLKLILSTILVLSTTISYTQVYDTSRHNTNYNAAWISCTSSTNPNTARGESHWINYDLRNNYDIFQISFWNLNDPARLTEGLKDIAIDISTDGISWQEAGTFTIPQSQGSGYYLGDRGINLNGTTARYVLITALNNYGGECYGLSEIKMDVQEAVLPVTLIDFIVECQAKGKIELVWEVESEYNNDYYTIQSSIDGIIWTEIGEVKGRNLKERSIYNFSHDGNSMGLVYYRIIQTDYDGTSTILPVAYADCQNTSTEVSLQPNPASSELNISIAGFSGESNQYEITNISGQVLMKGVLENGGNYLDISGLDSGTYFITISDDRAIIQRKIIKI